MTGDSPFHVPGHFSCVTVLAKLLLLFLTIHSESHAQSGSCTVAPLAVDDAVGSLHAKEYPTTTQDKTELEIVTLRWLQDWLGLLLNYDAKKRSELVTTLSRYLECGGSYDATAKALSVHRSTLKYRLQRIREISGHDLSCPDTHFNLQLATRAWQTLSTLRAT